MINGISFNHILRYDNGTIKEVGTVKITHNDKLKMVFGCILMKQVFKLEKAIL